MVKHFGIKLNNSKDELKLTRENYASLTNNKNTFRKNEVYSELRCKKFYEEGIKNFDANMNKFSLINKDEFDSLVRLYIEQYSQFKEIFDLNLYSGKSGYYIMVLDEYHQLYIGQSSDIKKRIMGHWNRKMPLDRLIFVGGVEGSILSIDSFRAFDTTRIFIYETEDFYKEEHKFIMGCPSKYRLNRVGGTIRTK